MPGAGTTRGGAPRRRGSARSPARPPSTTSGTDRRRRRREEVYELESRREAAEPVFSDGFSPELEAALAALSAAEREVVALRILLDLDTEAAARLLGISPTACSTRLSRALQKLEARLESDVLA